MKSLKKMTGILMLAILLVSSTQKAYSHCEIPCGIYGDSLRIALLYEHIETVEKSMNMINELSKSDPTNYNQIVRWVTNKEEHATKIQDLVSQYFLHQRIKITDPKDEDTYHKYLHQLELMHAMLVYAMKSKQSTELANIVKLRETLGAFEKSYFHSHKHSH